LKGELIHGVTDVAIAKLQSGVQAECTIVKKYFRGGP
jgi:hypothetical protein